MAKVKNKKRRLSENTNNKKERKNKKVLNPFEVHVNKEKINVLGRKVKNDRGMPGISRSKALKKRTRTLLEEYKVQNKANKFTDKRIGEGNTNMSQEDRTLARYTALRANSHKKSVFNLADDEILTHRGQTLSEIEKFDDPHSDDEDDLDENNQSGKLDSEFVGDAHFGGGVLKKTGIDGAKTHKDLIDQLITESKKRKAEKQRLKEQTLELTEKLDTEWKDLLPLVRKSRETEEVSVHANKVEDYDKVMRELKFEARGIPSDPLKTEDEIAKEEKKKLENLEHERLERMRGFSDRKLPNERHRSADDLDINFAYDSDPDITLSYNVKGESNFEIDAEVNGRQVGVENNDSEGTSEEDSGNEDGADESGTESEDNLSDLKKDDSDSGDEDIYVEKDNQISLQMESDKQDSDEESDTSKENGVPSNNALNKVELEDIQMQKDTKKLKRIIIEDNDSSKKQKINSKTEEIKTDLLKRKEIMEKARAELPYTFNLPDNYESLQELLQTKTCAEQSVVIERMIKCNHPSLAQGNKDQLGMLFAYLLQYINDVSLEVSDETSIKRCFSIFENIMPHIFDLAQFNQQGSHNSTKEVIKEKQMDFRSTRKHYPCIDVLLFLKLVSCLFPTSDFRHQVITPSLVFMDQMLNGCKVRNKRDIAYGLYLTTLVLEYTNLSKRYLPSSINFLSGILHMAIPKTGIKLIKVLPPFKSSSNTLVLFNNFSDEHIDLKLQITDLLNNEVDDEFKIRSFFVTLSLLKEFFDHFKELPSNYEIFETSLKYLVMIPINNYPEEVRNQYESFKSNVEHLWNNRKLEYVVVEKKRPKALRLYEPNIVKVFDGKKYKVQSKEKAERSKLLHKIKKEHKGALREIRRDNAFLGRVKIKQRIQSDLERKEKVKQLFAEASLQQSELNAMDRKKKRK